MNGLLKIMRLLPAGIFCFAVAAFAQTFPQQPLRVVVAYGAGGGSDSLMRAIAPELGELLGQQLVIDNRPGAGTVLGTQLVATAKPDGYTIMIADNAFMVNPFLMAKLPYDSLKNFVPIVSLASDSQVLAVVHPSLPVKSIKDLVALARARPGELNYASGGNGTLPHIMGEMLKSAARIKLEHIPYKSTAAAIFAVTSGETSIGFGGIFAVKGLVEANKLRVLGLAAAKRNPLMPNVPTFAEGGGPAIDGTGYRGLLAPAGTPREAIARINAETNKVLQMPVVKARLAELAFVPLGGTAEEFGRIINSEMEKWGKVTREAGIKVEQ